MNKKSKQRKKKKHAMGGEPYLVTRAVTHIRLVEVNPGKLAALDALAPVYLALCQLQRHEAWKQQQGMGNISPVKRRRRGISSVSPSSI